jgi:hypothetical protein
VLKARSRKLSLVLVLAMLMTMFAGLGTAQAAIVEYSAYSVPTIQTGIDFDKTLGSILIEIDDPTYLGDVGKEHWVTLKMPSGVSLDDPQTAAIEAEVKAEGAAVNSTVYGTVYATVYAEPIVKNPSTIDLKVALKDGNATGKIKFSLTFKKVKVQSGSGNLDVTFIPQSGSILPGGTVTIANIVSKGATQAAVSSVKSLGAGGGAIDTISIAELSAGVFETAGTIGKEGKIKLELPAGVTWDLSNGPVVLGAWDFSGRGTPASGNWVLSNGAIIKPITAASLNSKKDILTIEFVGNLTGKTTPNPLAGRLDIARLAIDIDEDDAKEGDIKVKISAENISGVTKQDLVIAKFGTYETTIIENEVTELIAGKDKQELGSFYIEETLGDSLIQNRTIVLELPSGVKWNTVPTVTFEKGSGTIEQKGKATDKKVRFDVKASTGTTAAKILIEEGEVYVEPNFEGDVELKVTGTAGVEGTVKVAEAVKAVDISASEVPNIIIGEQNVLAGDIIIKENVAEAIQEGKNIVIELAGGYVFYKEPTVKVTEGDLRIDDVDINNDDQLVIAIDKESNDPSTITISDIYITGYRYAPTGPVVAKFVAAEGNDDKKEFKGSTALDSLYRPEDKTDAKDMKYSEKSVGEVIIANCITPAEAAATAEFKIGSNIFYVNGIAKVMNVAPYIKNDRTYMPMRYVGEEVLGAEVVWDSTARTVTLTKDDTTVVFTIGSTSYTVNGEAMTADVAPEIANDRTMLPARYVAEAFGAIVGWDALTQTVLIQQ